MNRRNFLKKSTFAATGAYLLNSLPLNALGLGNKPSKHAILCIVAGLPKKDFMNLFATPENPMLQAGILMDMEYNGKAAGHRLALESILNGRYLYEHECQKQPLTKAALFQLLDTDSKKYIITSNRDFLLEADTSETRNLHHINEPDDDMRIAQRAALLCKNESPTLLVAHFMGADVAHGQASLAQKNIQTIGKGILQIWNATNENPTMKDNTLFIVMPDFGRNGYNNTLIDEYGKHGTDHSIADENTKNISCLMMSTSAYYNTYHGKKNITAESTDIAKTITEYIGVFGSEKFAGKNLLEQA